MKNLKHLTPEELQEIFSNENTSWKTIQSIKHLLPTIKLCEMDDEREWKVGAILANGEMKHFLVIN